jgi:inhibitor of cysteine peptidase
MKRVLVILAMVLLTAPLLTGCGAGKAVPTFTDSTQTINAKLNQEFIIALEANPTTGYDWQPVFDSVFISQVKKDYQQDDNNGQPLMGQGGTDYFTFKAIKTGEAKITLTYFRPWETPKTEDQQKVFNIIIK